MSVGKSRNNAGFTVFYQRSNEKLNSSSKNNNHYRNYDSFVYFNFDEIQECPEDLNTLISQIQRELIEVYENDFSKHNGRVNSGRIRMVFRSIASQLAKPNEKFMYGAVREGGRARDFEEAIECSYFLFLTRDFSNTWQVLIRAAERNGDCSH